MAIDLEGIMNRIMNMAEQKQKAMGYDNFGSVGAIANNDREFGLKKQIADSQGENLRGSIEVQKNAIAQKDRADLLAHPASSLDTTRRASYANAAIGKMNAEAEHYKGAGDQGQGVGAYYKAKADTQNALRPAYERLNPMDKFRVITEKDPIGSYPNSVVPSVSTPAVRASGQPLPGYYGPLNGGASPERYMVPPMPMSSSTVSNAPNSLPSITTTAPASQVPLSQIMHGYKKDDGSYYFSDQPDDGRLGRTKINVDDFSRRNKGLASPSLQ